MGVADDPFSRRLAQELAMKTIRYTIVTKYTKQHRFYVFKVYINTKERVYWRKTERNVKNHTLGGVFFCCLARFLRQKKARSTARQTIINPYVSGSLISDFTCIKK